MFNINIVDYDDPFESYYNILEKYVSLINTMPDDPNSVMGTSANIIPQTLYLKQELLAKFRLFKWMYQNKYIDCKSFEELDIPSKLVNIQKDYVAMTRHIHSIDYIWDNMIFQHLINDIQYFASIHLISDETKEEIKNMSAADIAAKITNSLRFDDNRNLVEEHRKISRCNKRAEGLEKILYKCPGCGAEFKNVTKGNVMKCEQCGNTVEYGRDGILHAIKGKTFDYISDWYDFERQDLKEQVKDENFRLDGKVALYVNNEKLNKFVKDGEGTLSVSKDGINYVGETGENKSLEFKIENRGTIAFKMGENLEVSEDGNIYRFAFTEGLFSTKFVLAIEELHKRYFD